MELSGGGGSLVPSRPDWNLCGRQKPHPAHPATVRLQAACAEGWVDYGAGCGGGDNFVGLSAGFATISIVTLGLDPRVFFI